MRKKGRMLDADYVERPWSEEKRYGPAMIGMSFT